MTVLLLLSLIHIRASSLRNHKLRLVQLLVRHSSLRHIRCQSGKLSPEDLEQGAGMRSKDRDLWLGSCWKASSFAS